MSTHIPLFKRVVAEFLGTAFLLAVVVGSGIMAQSICLQGIRQVALLANTIATGALNLVALILMFGSGHGASSGQHAHLRILSNVTFMDFWQKSLPAKWILPYVH